MLRRARPAPKVSARVWTKSKSGGGGPRSVAQETLLLVDEHAAPLEVGGVAPGVRVDLRDLVLDLGEPRGGVPHRLVADGRDGVGRVPQGVRGVRAAADRVEARLGAAL